MGLFEWLAGRRAEAEDEEAHAQARARVEGRSRELELEALWLRAAEQGDDGEPESSLAAYVELMSAAERAGTSGEVRRCYRVRALMGQAYCHLDLGRPAVARALLEEVPDELRSHPDLLARFAHAYGAALGALGDLVGMCHHLGRAVAVHGVLRHDGDRLADVLHLLLTTLHRHGAWALLLERCDQLLRLPGLDAGVEPESLVTLVHMYRAYSLAGLGRRDELARAMTCVGALVRCLPEGDDWRREWSTFVRAQGAE